MAKVSDVMSAPAVSVEADAPVKAVAKLLLERGISGAPVLDQGRLVGMVSDGDLLRRPEGRAREIMTRDVVSVGPETPLAEVARLLTRRHIKRVPVMDGDRLAGIVSRADLVRALADGALAEPDAPAIVPGIRRAAERGHSSQGLADVYYSFSFGDFFDEGRTDLGVLRALNEKCARPGAGPVSYGLRDVEIVTWLLEGAMDYEDSLGNQVTLRPGDAQCVSAGLGVSHSETYHGESGPTRLLKIWIRPGERGREASYEQRRFPEAQRRGRLCAIAAPDGRDGALHLHQDACIYAGLFDGDERARFEQAPGRLAYMHVARGSIVANGQALANGDALIVDREGVILEGGRGAEVLVLDLPERRARARG